MARKRPSASISGACAAQLLSWVMTRLAPYSCLSTLFLAPPPPPNIELLLAAGGGGAVSVFSSTLNSTIGRDQSIEAAATADRCRELEQCFLMNEVHEPESSGMSQCRAQCNCCHHSILFIFFNFSLTSSIWLVHSAEEEEKRASIVSVWSARVFKFADGGWGIKVLLSEFVQTGAY